MEMAKQFDYSAILNIIPIKEKQKRIMYVIEILRYGKEKLGRDLFGVYDDLNKAIDDAKEYNWYRGGKYPTIIVNECELNEGMPFECKSYVLGLENHN